jgi:hypothetical protein
LIDVTALEIGYIVAATGDDAGCQAAQKLPRLTPALFRYSIETIFRPA